jgi:hypothetical protein
MKVTFEMEDVQVDAIIVDELERHILMTAKYIVAADNDVYVHPEDDAYNRKLIPALFIVYEYFAGKEAAANLKKQVGGGS